MLRGYREIIIKKGNMSKEEWISINTDGPYCPLAKVYDKKEAFELFKIFEDLRMEAWGFNNSRWSFIGKLIPTSVSHRLGRIWGWHRIVYGRKPV